MDHLPEFVGPSTAASASLAHLDLAHRSSARATDSLDLAATTACNINSSISNGISNSNTSGSTSSAANNNSSSSSSSNNLNRLKTRSNPCLVISESEPSSPLPLQARSRSVSWGDANGKSLEESVSFWQDDAPCRCRHSLRRSASPQARASPFLEADLPLSHEELMRQLSEQGIQLEHTIIRWPMVFLSVRVLNLAYNKRVFVRLTCDRWKTFTDVDATYLEQSSDGCTDEFQAGVRVPRTAGESDEMELAICLVANSREYWDNNRGRNYRLRICHKHKAVPDAPSPAGLPFSEDVCEVCSPAATAASPPVSPLKSILSRKSSLKSPSPIAQQAGLLLPFSQPSPVRSDPSLFNPAAATIDNNDDGESPSDSDTTDSPPSQ